MSFGSINSCETSTELDHGIVVRLFHIQEGVMLTVNMNRVPVLQVFGEEGGYIGKQASFTK